MRWRAILALAALLVTGCGEASRGQGTAGDEDPELEALVSALLEEIEGFAYLEAKSAPVARRASSETLRAYLLERLEAEYPGESLAKVELAYRTFGLIPDTLDLRAFLVDLLLEQAMGYYDPARNVLFVKHDAPEEMLEAVIVHELVHALQDQVIDLDSLVHGVPENDRRTAIQSAMEGHAMAAMMAYQISQMTDSRVSAEDLPEIGPELAGGMSSAEAYPQLARAPTIIREPLLFAYLGGARYVQRLWDSRPGHPPPFDDWMPESTEQIMHTEKILATRDSPLGLQIGEPPSGWRVEYARDLGELEIEIYLREHLGQPQAAAKAASGWDGDAYAVLSRGDDLALVWYSAWDSRRDAEEFAAAYRDVFVGRFGGGTVEGRLVADRREASVDLLELEGQAVVRVVETTAGVRLSDLPPVRARQGG